MRRTSIMNIIVVAGLLVAFLSGCSSMPLSKAPTSRLQVRTDPANAIVYLKQRHGFEDEPKLAPPSPLGEYWSVGTTPYKGDLSVGYWDVRIEAPGFEPIDILVKAEKGKTLSYDLNLETFPRRVAIR